MFLKKLYRVAKPLITNNKLLKRLIFSYGQAFNILPKVLTVALTYRCQCHCFHCGVSDYRKVKEDEFSTEEVKDLINQAKKIQSIVQITFTGGEPLLRKDLAELIKHSKMNGFFTKIDTNAATLDKDLMTGFRDVGLDRVGISLDHYKEEVHDTLRRHHGLFRKVNDAVQFCHDFNISCYLQTYVTRQNMLNGDLDKILDLAEKLNVEKTKIQPPAILGSFRDNKEVILRHKDFLALEGMLSKHKSAYIESEVFSALDYKNFCRMNFKTNIYITSYGDVLPCCWFFLSFGNIREKSLKDILNQMYKSQVFKKLLTYDGCLCSNQEFMHKFFGNAKEWPVKFKEIENKTL